MGLSDDADKLKKQFEELKKVAEKLGYRLNEFTGVSDAAKDAKTVEELLKSWNKELLDVENTLSYVGKSLADNVNELIKGNEYTNTTVKSSRKLVSISRELTSMRQGDSTLDSKKVKRLEEQAKLHHLILEQTNETFQGSVDEKKILEEQIKNSKKLLGEFGKIKEEAKQFEKSTGVAGGALKGMKKIPILGELIKSEQVLEDINDAAAAGKGRWGTLGAAMKSMGKGLMESLSDPLVTLGLLYKGFKALLDLGFRVDTEVTNLSKSMAVSKDEAKGVRDRFVEIQNEGKNVYETSKNLTAAQLELADAAGATRGFTEQQVRDQVLLTKNMKLSNEEAAGIQQFMLSSGRSAKDINKDVIKQTAALAKQSGIQLDNKKILGEVAKTSGQLRLQYANNPALIAKAVVQTQKLGVSLEQAKKAAQGLLNFEQSIEDELSAELMLGKDLNLEKARQLALNGDAAGAMEEIARQTGSAADFAKMNVLQQESLAKAVGMTADELADSLIKRENLAKLGDETRAQIEEQIELAKAAGDQDKVNALERSLGNEEEAQAALERISAQETFNQNIEKLKIMLGDLLAGPAMGLANWLTSILKQTTLLKTLFYGISIILGTVMVASFAKSIASLTVMVVKAIAFAAAWAIANPIMAGVGLAVAAGVGAVVYSQMKDGAIDPKGGMIVSGEKGSIQLDKEDSIIAGTNLFGKNKKSGGGGSSSMDLTPLITEIRALASRPVQVSIDGTKVIEATTGKNPNVDSDTMNKNSNKIQ